MKTIFTKIKLKEKFRNYYFIAKVILLLVIISLSTKILLADDIDSYEHIDHYYLEMLGTIKQAQYKDFDSLKIIDSAVVTVLNLDDKLFERVYSNEIGECFFKIPLNNQFVVKVSKKGWLTKTINIDTRLNGNKSKKYRMLFEVEMFEDIHDINTTLLNNPIANVFFNEYLKSFDYGFRYTNGINKKIEKNYLNYYNLHKRFD